MVQAPFIAVVIFVIAYALIISEKINRTIIAMLGAALLIITGVVNQETAIHYIDFNTLGLLLGMMIIVLIMEQTGLFQAVSLWSVKKVKGHPLPLLAAFSIITFFSSALLDNVSTVLLIAPITFDVARRLKISPMPFLMSEIFMSNIGGTATMIGDPPNIMIGSAVKELSFLDFITNLAPVTILIAASVLLLLFLIYRKQLHVPISGTDPFTSLNPAGEIRDKVLLIKSLVVLLLTVAGFFIHQYIAVGTATIALAGAFFLLLITGERYLGKALSGVEWTTLFFFIGLFVLVSGLVETGIITDIAHGLLELTGGQKAPAAFLVLWMSGIVSSFIDNIPFVATMIPLVKDMGKMGMDNLEPVWWSLSLGACLGGNGLLIGASANLIVAGLAHNEGHPITFVHFMKVGFPVMLLSLAISSGYIYLRYLL